MEESFSSHYSTIKEFFLEFLPQNFQTPVCHATFMLVDLQKHNRAVEKKSREANIFSQLILCCAFFSFLFWKQKQENGRNFDLLSFHQLQGERKICFRERITSEKVQRTFDSWNGFSQFFRVFFCCFFFLMHLLLKFNFDIKCSNSEITWNDTRKFENNFFLLVCRLCRIKNLR